MPEHKYSPLGELPVPNGPKAPRAPLFLGLYSAGLAVVLVASFFAGRYSYVWEGARLRASGIELPTDIFFGDVRRRPTVLERDARFVDSEPRRFFPNGTIIPNIWEDVYPGTFVAIPDGDSAGVEKGQPMSRIGENPDSWPDGSQGFGVAAMHQLHCVMAIKQTLIAYGRDEVREDDDLEHIFHCIEMVRQAIMCHADLALEPLVDDGFTQVSLGWGGVHMCRDWNEVHKAVMAMRITRNLKTGEWQDTSEEETEPVF